MRGPLAHLRELRQWFRWHWANRPRLGGHRTKPQDREGRRRWIAEQKREIAKLKRESRELRKGSRGPGFFYNVWGFFRWHWDNRPRPIRWFRHRRRGEGFFYNVWGWFRWHWDNRPRIRVRLRPSAEDREARRRWRQQHKEELAQLKQERRELRRSRKRDGFLHNVWGLIRWHWDNRPRLRVKSISPAAEVREFKKWRESNQDFLKEVAAAKKDRRTRRWQRFKRQNPVTEFWKWMRWHWENRPVVVAVATVLVVAGAALIVYLVGAAGV